MKEFIISEAQTEKAVLVGLITPEQNEQKVKEYLDELAFLADTAGVEAETFLSETGLSELRDLCRFRQVAGDKGICGGKRDRVGDIR